MSLWLRQEAFESGDLNSIPGFYTESLCDLGNPLSDLYGCGIRHTTPPFSHPFYGVAHTCLPPKGVMSVNPFVWKVHWDLRMEGTVHRQKVILVGLLPCTCIIQGQTLGLSQTKKNNIAKSLTFQVHVGLLLNKIKNLSHFLRHICPSGGWKVWATWQGYK